MVRYVVAYDESLRAGPEAEGQAPAKSTWGLLAARVKHALGRNHSPPPPAGPAGPLIVGYASIWMMVDESHLTSIAVRKSHQRQGIGELLLMAVVRLSVQMKADVVTLEARASNHSAQALYVKYGFKAVGVRRRYYTDNSEDAVIMTTGKINSPSYQALFKELEARYADNHPAAVLAGR